MIADNFKISGVLGQGGSAKVFLVTDEHDDKFAMKVVANSKHFSNNAAMKVLANEVEILQQASGHPNIIRA